MKKKKTAIVLAIVVLLICGMVWAFWGGPDPQVQKLQDMRKEFFGEGKQPSREQRDRFREEMQKLSPEQRRELWQPMREQMSRRIGETVDGYFALPPDERGPYLDEQIEEGEKRRKEWEKRRREREANRGPAGANRGRPGGGRNRTPEERAQRRNRRLDHTTPEQRAKWAEFRDAMRKRRVELGLPASPWGPRGPRGR